MSQTKKDYEIVKILCYWCSPCTVLDWKSLYFVTALRKVIFHLKQYLKPVYLSYIRWKFMLVIFVFFQSLQDVTKRWGWNGYCVSFMLIVHARHVSLYVHPYIIKCYINVKQNDNLYGLKTCLYKWYICKYCSIWYIFIYFFIHLYQLTYSYLILFINNLKV